jgi:hypothetical protein
VSRSPLKLKASLHQLLKLLHLIITVKVKGRNESNGERFNFELDKMTKKDKNNVLELIKIVRIQED